MTAPLIYSMAPTVLNTAKLATQNRRLVPAIVNRKFKHSGNLFPSVDMVPGAVPMILFKTPLKDALATIGMGLLALTNFDLYLTKFSASTFVKDAGSTHTKWNATAGCAYIVGWSIEQNGVAMAEVAVVPFSSDGSTHPLTRSDNNAMISLSAEPLLHTLGPISVGGAVRTGLTKLGVSMGHILDIRISDGDLYPRTAALLGGEPSLTGEHIDPATLLTTVGLPGLAITANVIAYWKSYDATTQLVSTANAVSATIASGRVVPDDLSDEQDQPSKLGFRIEPLSASGTHPIVISTAATAPAT